MEFAIILLQMHTLLQTVNWTQIIMAGLGGGGIVGIFSAIYYRGLNKKRKQSQSSSESYLDYEKVIDSNTHRVEKLRDRIDTLYTLIDKSRKVNAVQRLKIFELSQWIKIITEKHDLDKIDEYQTFYKRFYEDYDKFNELDVDVDQPIENGNKDNNRNKEDR